ncbi:hypothetical protein SBA4_3390023 [Candidatus Sulfopaludibacter sp. SbA4]|nr:hypothetical protein SBA4_3390023 [Candidatus Sulfopaludibacter sp. SbA4]
MAVIDSEDGRIEPRPAKDGKWPAYQHYPGDFERDLAGNSLAAQGLWIRMLGWMHHNEAHRGFLELPNGEPMTEKQISLRIGRSIKEVRPLLGELKSFGVFSVTPSGALYCRRMARETHISEVRRAAAKSRADKAARAANGTFAGDVTGMGDGEFAPAKTPATGEQDTVLSSSSSVSVSSINTLCSSGDERGAGNLELIPPKPKPADGVRIWFDAEFWPAYPRKTAKPQALKAARRHGKTAADRAAIVECLKRRLPALQEQFRADGDYRPYPASWLNQTPWLDGTEVGRPAAVPRIGGKGSDVIDEAMRLYDARLTE